MALTGKAYGAWLALDAAHCANVQGPRKTVAADFTVVAAQVQTLRVEW